MDPWGPIEKAAGDTRSGSADLARRAAEGVRLLRTKRDLNRAARLLLRAHPEMALLWRLCATASEAGDVQASVDLLIRTMKEEAAALADATRWAFPKRGTAVLTHSASGAVFDAVVASKARIGRVVCTTSLPGGEGRSLAKRLGKEGLTVEIVADAAVGRTCSAVDVVIVGADAVTERAVVNKVGTLPLALSAREAGIACYAVAGTTKLIAHRVVNRSAPGVDATPLELFDAILTERGPKRPAWIRRAAGKTRIPRALEAIKP